MTIMNDWSARAIQMEEMKLNLGPAKGKDFATSLGPYLVTIDELLPRATPAPDGRGLRFDLEMRASLNGRLLSRGNLKDMTWTFAQILERVSDGVTLYPGDVIGSGTCGTGCLLELNGSRALREREREEAPGAEANGEVWLKSGDVVELQVDGLGTLTNRVVAGQ
jgi:fumarylacetoacetate (FAA) hydrolase